MIDSKQLNKYLLYALGEIVLVVIGILIALQINDWSQENKNRNLEQEYYCRLLEDVNQDREQVNELIANGNTRLKEANEGIRILQQEETPRIEAGEQILGSTRAIYTDFNPNDAAFEDLKSGANLNIIKDKSIIKALNRYYNKLDELKSIIMINGELAVNIRFAHDDNFANGLIEAGLRRGQENCGLELDVYNAIKVDEKALLNNEMKDRLYRESILYTFINNRQLSLYGYMLDEINKIEATLRPKCETTTRSSQL